MNQILQFLTRLRDNNNREWFQAHKDEYNRVKLSVEALTADLLQALATIEPEAAYLSPADCTYRIYRDTRFSLDKTPYKTLIGIFMNPPYGKKAMTAGHYLHLEPDNVFFAAGTVCLPSPTLRRLRQSIYDEIDEYRAIVDAPEFRRLFPHVGDKPLKTAPKGFPRDWPYLDYIRPRDFVAYSATLPSDTPLSDLPQLLLPYMKQASRFNAFLNFTLAD